MKVSKYLYYHDFTVWYKFIHVLIYLLIYWTRVCFQGIYRVNGVKTRVEKLCQAFENGKELVELSQCSPHDISNVLKLYLRQVWATMYYSVFTLFTLQALFKVGDI